MATVEIHSYIHMLDILMQARLDINWWQEYSIIIKCILDMDMWIFIISQDDIIQGIHTNTSSDSKVRTYVANTQLLIYSVICGCL